MLWEKYKSKSVVRQEHGAISMEGAVVMVVILTVALVSLSSAGREVDATLTQARELITQTGGGNTGPPPPKKTPKIKEIRK